MLHFTCDLCGKDMRPGDDQRYVINIEAQAAQDPAEITEADLDLDHMEAVSQLLNDKDEDELDDEMVQPHKKFRYDLCADCHKKFLRDPLNREVQKFHFSKN